MTAQDFLYDARALIDEYNEDGTVTSSDDADIKTIETNGIRYINMGVQEIFRESEDYDEHIILNKKVPNLLGDQFRIQEFIGTDQTYPETLEGVEGAKAYFFTLDSDATVLIQEYNGATWDTLETLALTPTEETDYNGLINATDPSYPIQLVFSGTTYYKHLNRCLYEYPYKADSIPDYKPWKLFDMPDNYGELQTIVSEYPIEQYNINSNYKWQGYKTLAVNYRYEGSLKIIYKIKPTEITAATDTIELQNPIAEQFVRFFVAAKMATTENPDLVNFFEQKANEMKFQALKTRPAGEEKIQDVYFNSGNQYNYGYYGKRWY